jgi:hypothetical protein
LEKRMGVADPPMARRRLMIYSKNNKGPSTDPWGTPCLILGQFDTKLQ